MTGAIARAFCLRPKVLILDEPFGALDAIKIMEDPQYYDLRNQALEFLYSKVAHDDAA